MSTIIHKIFLKKSKNKLPNIHAIFKANGPIYLSASQEDLFTHMARLLCSQQLSLSAADTIWRKIISQLELDNYLLFDAEQVTEFNTIFFNPNRVEGQLHPILDKVCDEFTKLEDEEQDLFKSYLLAYMKAYSYLSQIITFQDQELEKCFIFCKYLYKKLPKRAREKFELDSSVNLDDLRISYIRDVEAGLIDEVEILNKLLFTASQSLEESKELLSEIVNQVNHLYGVNLSENDLSELGEIENLLALDENTKAVMTGDNTEENKKAYLKKQFESAVYGLVGKNIEMFKKLETNQSAQNMIFKAIYKNYTDGLSFSQ